MTPVQNKSIAIIGGGPGGLTLARLLQMNGAAVTVFERDVHKDARMKGATLDLHETSGLAARRAAGLMDAFKASFRPGAEFLRLLDKNARIVYEDAPQQAGDVSRPEIDRGPLQEILLDSLAAGTVVWDSQFTRMVPISNGWQVDFKNGSSVYADIVVAADGANSKLRPYITPVKPFYAGVTAVEGAVYHSADAVPGIHRLLNGGKLFILDDEKSLIVSSKGDGSLVFYCTCHLPEDWVHTSGLDFADKNQVLAWFNQTFSGWTPLYDTLFQNAAAAFVPRPLYCFPPDQTWDALPSVTMLGDAAHLMPPFAGEGVNMAMQDALELAQCLTGGYPDTRSAIARYETNMRARAGAVAQDSLDATAVLHSPQGMAFMSQMLG